MLILSETWVWPKHILIKKKQAETISNFLEESQHLVRNDGEAQLTEAEWANSEEPRRHLEI